MSTPPIREPYNKPLPQDEPLSRPYWSLAKEHKLSVQRCCSCGDLHFPPGPVCPICLSDEQDFKVVSGRGTLLSWCTFHKGYWEGFHGDLPYNVCLVRLEEGPVIISNFIGSTPESMKMGMPVKALFDDVTDQVTLVRFTDE